YYTLSVIAHAGVGTDQLDGNTRLCTATAAQALQETFGCDGQPCSLADLDVTDCLLLVGSNPAENQTVLWTRVLDRRARPAPPPPPDVARRAPAPAPRPPARPPPPSAPAWAPPSPRPAASSPC